MAQVAFCVPTPLIDRIDELAEAESLSRSTWVRRAVVAALRAQDEEAPK